MRHSSLFDPREYRNALGTFITGVTIVTTLGQDETPTGLTVNSFNSLSLDPPMVLWSLAKDSLSLPAFEQNEHWAVHILSAKQEELSNRFAQRGADKFEGTTWKEGINRIPILSGCSSVLQCKTAFKYQGGDHIIVIGEVLRFERSDAPPLVFHAGKYAVATRKLDDIPKSLMQPRPVADSRFEDGFIGYLLSRASHQFLRELNQAEELQQYGFSREERVVLTILCLNDPMPLDRLNSLTTPHSQGVTPEIVKSLADRKLLRRASEEGAAVCSLTEGGHDTALHLIATAKSLEAKILDKIGYWEALSLKNLLKQLILLTSPDDKLPVE